MLQSVGDRWIELIEILQHRQTQVNTLLELNRLHNESDAISIVLESHQKWLLNAEEALNNPEELKKIMSQCDVSSLSLSFLLNLFLNYY